MENVLSCVLHNFSLYRFSNRVVVKPCVFEIYFFSLFTTKESPCGQKCGCNFWPTHSGQGSPTLSNYLLVSGVYDIIIFEVCYLLESDILCKWVNNLLPLNVLLVYSFIYSWPFTFIIMTFVFVHVCSPDEGVFVQTRWFFSAINIISLKTLDICLDICLVLSLNCVYVNSRSFFGM